MITYHNSGSFPYIISTTGLHYCTGDVSNLPNNNESNAGGVYIVYCDGPTHSQFAGIFIPYVGGGIYIKKADNTFSKMSIPMLRTVTDTTTATGAIAVPSDIQSFPIIDAHLSGSTGLVFRRDTGWFTVKNNHDFNPMANTTVSIVVWYLPV